MLVRGLGLDDAVAPRAADGEPAKDDEGYRSEVHEPGDDDHGKGGTVVALDAVPAQAAVRGGKGREDEYERDGAEKGGEELSRQ